MRRWLGNPRLHFVVLGLLVFAADGLLRGQGEAPTLSVSPDGREIIRVPERLPSPGGGSGDRERWAEQEVLYREALRLGFDRDDTIVRRRLVQKMQHMLEMTATSEPYARADIAAYFEAHRGAYRQPRAYDFAHVFIDPARRDDPEAAARQLRRRLNAADVPAGAAGEYGDAFAGRSRFVGAESAWIRAELGEGFYSALERAARARWIGPVTSKYGEHLVHVTAFQPARVPSLDAVWEAVVRDFEHERREHAKQRLLEAMKARYRIVGLPDD